MCLKLIFKAQVKYVTHWRDNYLNTEGEMKTLEGKQLSLIFFPLIKLILLFDYGEHFQWTHILNLCGRYILKKIFILFPMHQSMKFNYKVT